MGLRMAVMLVLSGGLNESLKMIFHTPRPFWFDSRVQSLSQETSFGMPSGHSQNSASLWGMMAATAKRKWVTIGMFVLIFLIGVSRIYLGMHFLHDVLSGWLIAAILIWIYLRLEKPIIKWIAPKKLLIQIFYIFLFSILIILLGLGSKLSAANWQMPESWIETARLTGGAEPDPFKIEGFITLAGVAFGFLSGYAWLVKKYGTPQVKGSWLKRLLRYIEGIVGVIALYLGLSLLFKTESLVLEPILRFVRYAAIGLWVSALAPVLFKLQKLHK
jgi:hypothetical protein